MIHRHLDYEPGTPVERLGMAAIDDLLDRGDLRDWAPLATAVAGDPHGRVAESVLQICRAHPMYGTGRLWSAWIHDLRRGTAPTAPATGLAGLRRRRRLTQAQVASRLGRSQSDVSKLERRRDLRVSTLSAYVGATGGRLRLMADYGDGRPVELSAAPTGGPGAQPASVGTQDDDFPLVEGLSVNRV